MSPHLSTPRLETLLRQRNLAAQGRGQASSVTAAVASSARAERQLSGHAPELKSTLATFKRQEPPRGAGGSVWPATPQRSASRGSDFAAVAACGSPSQGNVGCASPSVLPGQQPPVTQEFVTSAAAQAGASTSSLPPAPSAEAEAATCCSVFLVPGIAEGDELAQTVSNAFPEDSLDARGELNEVCLPITAGETCSQMLLRQLGAVEALEDVQRRARRVAGYRHPPVTGRQEVPRFPHNHGLPKVGSGGSTSSTALAYIIAQRRDLPQDLERQLGTVLLVEASYQGEARRSVVSLPKRVVVAVEDPEDGPAARSSGPFADQVKASLSLRGLDLPVTSVRRGEVRQHRQLLCNLRWLLREGSLPESEAMPCNQNVSETLPTQPETPPVQLHEEQLPASSDNAAIRWPLSPEDSCNPPAAAHERSRPMRKPPASPIEQQKCRQVGEREEEDATSDDPDRSFHRVSCVIRPGLTAANRQAGSSKSGGAAERIATALAQTASVGGAGPSESSDCATVADTPSEQALVDAQDFPPDPAAPESQALPGHAQVSQEAQSRLPGEQLHEASPVIQVGNLSFGLPPAAIAARQISELWKPGTSLVVVTKNHFGTPLLCVGGDVSKGLINLAPSSGPHGEQQLMPLFWQCLEQPQGASHVAKRAISSSLPTHVEEDEEEHESVSED